MEETIRKALEEVNSNLEVLRTLDSTSDNYKKIIEQNNRLLETITPMIKIQTEKESKSEELKNRKDDEKRKDEETKKEKRIDTALEIGKILVPLLTTISLVIHDDKLSKRLLHFEKTGMLTYTVPRNFFSKIGRRK